MSILDEVTGRMKEAMRNKDTGQLNALRNIRAAFLTEMKKDNSETLEDDACVTLLRRLEKQRKESIDAYEKGGRDELAEQEKLEQAFDRIIPWMAKQPF